MEKLIYKIRLLQSYKCDDINMKKIVIDRSRLNGYGPGVLYKMNMPIYKTNKAVWSSCVGLQYSQVLDESNNIINSSNLIKSLIDMGHAVHKKNSFEVYGAFDSGVEGYYSTWKDVAYVKCHFELMNDYFYHTKDITLMGMDEEGIEMFTFGGEGVRLYERLYRFLIDGKVIGYLDYSMCKRLRLI